MRVSRFILSGLALMLTLTISQSAQANLLVNPGFEDPVLAAGDVFGAVGWTDFGGGTFTIKASPHSGDNALKLFGTTSGVFQDFPAAEGQLWEGSVWGLNPSFDPMLDGQIGAVNIEWHGAGGFISFEDGGFMSAASPQGDTSGDYIFGSVSGIAPPNTTTARLVLITGNFAGTGGGAVFFDDAVFTPEPASLALLGLGGALLIGRRRRAA